MTAAAWRKSSRSADCGNCAEVASWRTASASDSQACVEVADGVLVRDSADRDGPVLAFPVLAWREFTASLAATAR